MISDVLYKKEIDNKIYYFSCQNPNERVKALQFGDNIPISGIEWIYDNERYSLSFKANEFGKCHIHNDKIFIVYKSSTSDFSPPNNLVIYNAIGEIKKILSPPISPLGEEFSGFDNVWDLNNVINFSIPENFKKGVGVTVYEHIMSEWIYKFFLNPDTFEFLFFHRSKY